MQDGIHPTYHQAATITCACGNTLTIGSTKESMQVELCSKCHPFFTGTQKIVDTARRVDRFQQRAAKHETTAAVRAGRRVKREKDAKHRATKVAKIEKE